MSAEKADPADRPEESGAFADAFDTDGAPMRVLAVGASPAAVDMIRSRTSAEVIDIPFASLTLALLAQWTPDAVVAPLVGAGFDIVDLGQRLEKLAFGGRLYALAGLDTRCGRDHSRIARSLSGADMRHHQLSGRMSRDIRAAAALSGTAPRCCCTAQRNRAAPPAPRHQGCAPPFPAPPSRDCHREFPCPR